MTTRSAGRFAVRVLSLIIATPASVPLDDLNGADPAPEWVQPTVLTEGQGAIRGFRVSEDKLPGPATL